MIRRAAENVSFRILKRGFFFDFFGTIFNTAPDSTVSEDAGVVPRTVATTTLAVRRSNHSATSHPQIG
jgi:hypothetical protein